MFFGLAVPLVSEEPAAADAAKTEGPKVFIVSRVIDGEALLKGIPFVTPVAVRDEAQVEVLIEPRDPASGAGFVITFTGLRDCAGMEQTLDYAPGPGETQAQVEAGLSRTLKMGLMKYVAATPAARRIRIRLMDQVKPTDVVDRWDSWVFSASANGMFQGERTYGSRMFFGSFSANRVTPALKIRMALSASLQKDRFDYEGEEIHSRSESRGFEGLFAKSLGPHWSAGVFLTGASSTYENIRTKVAVAPAVEFNVFPYSESTRRQLRFTYWIGTNLVRYREETIYEKLRENLPQQGLGATVRGEARMGDDQHVARSPELPPRLRQEPAGAQYGDLHPRLQGLLLRGPRGRGADPGSAVPAAAGRLDRRDHPPAQTAGDVLQLLPDGRLQLHLRLHIQQHRQPALRQRRRRRLHPHQQLIGDTIPISRFSPGIVDNSEMGIVSPFSGELL